MDGGKERENSLDKKRENLENPISKECLCFEAGLPTLRGYYITVTDEEGRYSHPNRKPTKRIKNKICRQGEGGARLTLIRSPEKKNEQIRKIGQVREIEGKNRG